MVWTKARQRVPDSTIASGVSSRKSRKGWYITKRRSAPPGRGSGRDSLEACQAHYKRENYKWQADMRNPIEQKTWPGDANRRTTGARTYRGGRKRHEHLRTGWKEQRSAVLQKKPPPFLGFDKLEDPDIPLVIIDGQTRVKEGLWGPPAHSIQIVNVARESSRSRKGGKGRKILIGAFPEEANKNRKGCVDALSTLGVGSTVLLEGQGGEGQCHRKATQHVFVMITPKKKSCVGEN